jgi:hypothetical protein
LIHLCVKNLQAQLLDFLNDFDHLQLKVLNLALHKFDIEFLPIATLSSSQFVAFLPISSGNAVSGLGGEGLVQSLDFGVGLAVELLQLVDKLVLFVSALLIWLGQGGGRWKTGLVRKDLIGYGDRSGPENGNLGGVLFETC